MCVASALFPPMSEFQTCFSCLNNGKGDNDV